MTVKSVGFIGLGLMGRPMALNLCQAGFAVHVWARRAEATQPLVAAGAVACANAAEVASRSEIVITMVADAPDVEAVVFGGQGVVDGAREGLIVIDMSTIAPTAAQALARRLAERGITMLDAPVSGGERGAIEATLTIMAGGEAAAYAKAKPLFEAMGKTVSLIGPAGAGQVAKACNQIVTGVGVAAVAEAFNFARCHGVAVARVREALLGGFAYSAILENHGARMVAGDDQPGFKAWMHRKDMHIVLDEAHRLGVALPASAAAAQSFNAMVGSGLGERDSVAMLGLLARLSGAAGGPAKATAAATTNEAAAMRKGAEVTKVTKVGFIGLGVMGVPMVRRLLAAGYEVAVWARRVEAAEAICQAGAQWCDTPAALAARSEVVMSIVTNSADVEALAFGADGLAAGLAAGAVHVDLSTIAPSMARKLAQAYAGRGVGWVDAPVSGGEQAARDGTLAIMAGGAAAELERVRPLLACLGRTIVHVGEAGAGQVAKACNQMVMVSAIQACAEAMLLARAHGVNPAAVRQALMGGSAASRMLDMMGARMVERRFHDGIQARLHHKDFGILMRAAAACGAPMPVGVQVSQQLNALMGQGWGLDDTSSLLRVLEAAAGGGNRD